MGEFWGVGTVKGPRKVESELLLNEFLTQTRVFFMTLTAPAACETSGFLKGAFKAPVKIKGVCLGRVFSDLFSSELEEVCLLPGCKLVHKLCKMEL